MQSLVFMYLHLADGAGCIYPRLSTYLRRLTQDWLLEVACLRTVETTAVRNYTHRLAFLFGGTDGKSWTVATWGTLDRIRYLDGLSMIAAARQCSPAQESRFLRGSWDGPLS
jgi:hypothetical protein